ncbi:MAG TPA: hypothetical protein VKD72_39955, partial [Gemmataceae bacterium]|nr:hypothetical protein [Gemmataceae bacterium]
MTTPNAAENETAQGTTDRTGHAAPAESGTTRARRGEDTVVAASSAAGTTQTTETPQAGQGTTSGHAQEERYQRAYLLQQVKDSSGGKLAKGKANRFPRAVARELNLTAGVANTLRDQLVQEGRLATTKKGGSITYELTPTGETYLQTLEHKPLPAGTRGHVHEADVPEEVRKYRRTFLLFQLFEIEGQALDQKAINRFREPGRKFLDLKAPAANAFRAQMIAEGLIEEHRQGRNATYRLTPAGREELGATAHFPDVELSINGRVLNDLLEAARDAARQFQAPEGEHAPSRAELTEAVFEAFEQLR